MNIEFNHKSTKKYWALGKMSIAKQPDFFSEKYLVISKVETIV